jgi:hypothetical protein
MRSDVSGVMRQQLGNVISMLVNIRCNHRVGEYDSGPTGFANITAGRSYHAVYGAVQRGEPTITARYINLDNFAFGGTPLKGSSVTAAL